MEKMHLSFLGVCGGGGGGGGGGCPSEMKYIAICIFMFINDTNEELTYSSLR